MIWTAPSIELHSLSNVTPATGVGHDFVATGGGFITDVSQLLFTRADTVIGTGMKPYQIIPCVGVTVHETEDGQEVRFKSVLDQREAGSYHLVAWNPPLGNVNQACVLEWAMTLVASSNQPVEVRLKK